jgi:hypothetical protein
MTFPVDTTSTVYTAHLREDLPREVARAYWSGPHGQYVKELRGVIEYNQHHFSAIDHGFWPATPTVGTVIPADWRTDGFAEVRFANLAALLRAPLHMRGIFFDEQNVFDRVIGHMTGPGGGRWWTDGHAPSVGHRTALLLRRRRGVSGSMFRTFVHERLGPALHEAGARDLRSYTFVPSMLVPHPTPGVTHGNPPHRRYHAAVLFGGDSRATADDVIASPSIQAVVKQQHQACTAVHAFAVDRTVPVIGRAENDSSTTAAAKPRQGSR